MFIHYEITKGKLKEQQLLNCDHIISARYVPACTSHESAAESEDGEEHTYKHDSLLEILTTEQKAATIYGIESGIDVFGAAAESVLHKTRGEQADAIWDLLLANVNALEPF